MKNWKPGLPGSNPMVNKYSLIFLLVLSGCSFDSELSKHDFEEQARKSKDRFDCFLKGGIYKNGWKQQGDCVKISIKASSSASAGG